MRVEEYPWPIDRFTLTLKRVCRILDHGSMNGSHGFGLGPFVGWAHLFKNMFIELSRVREYPVQIYGF